MREIVHLQAGQCGNQIGAKVENMFPELVSSIWNPVRWIQSVLVRLDKSSGQTTSCSVS
ncbi:Tubulin beta-4B chain [Desmophyllum pertusum]|uniref:Tubulin beta-4B chain n=1 Tax=Desmophyllum pertusum TaxID=174260 RepID=A0A9W9YP18_9CNID|nr:Tubulin beta-4B chain [Desmophyllum pertusum]